MTRQGDEPMQFESVPIVAVQCQAILCCRQGTGKQCSSQATRFHGQRAVCWLHRSAAKNRDRVAPVEFVGGV